MKQTEALRNEAAERLMERVRAFHPHDAVWVAQEDLDAALAAERQTVIAEMRELVEDLKYAIAQYDWNDPPRLLWEAVKRDDVLAILDTLAARKAE